MHPLSSQISELTLCPVVPTNEHTMNSTSSTLVRRPKGSILKLRCTDTLKHNLLRIAIARESDVSTLVRDACRKLVMEHDRQILR